MRLPVVVFYSGFVLTLAGFFMIISGCVGLIYADNSAALLMVSGIIIGGLGAFPAIFIPRTNVISSRESIAVVAFGWLACTFTGAIPYYLFGSPFTFINALFESISGFTTTGASILRTVEDLPKGLLFWRASTHWIGGVGIIAFALTVMPQMGQVNRSFLSQEYSGLGAPPHFARARDITRGLFAVYIGLTLTETVLLMMTGQSWFDALTNSFATIATGGFSVRNLSIAYYDNGIVDVIIMVFMLLGALNFIFLLSLFTRPRKTTFGWEVAKYYVGTILLVSLIVSLAIKGSVYSSWMDAIRYGFFQVITVATQTGFGTADSSVWPTTAQIAITMVTILGGCAGSTAGAIKFDRIVLFFKLFKFRIRNIAHPTLVSSIRIDGKIVNLENVERAVFYIPVYLAILCISTLLLGWAGLNGVDSFTGSVACMANAGPGMGSIGTMENYAHIPILGKSILIIVMLLGRLEVFALVMPFTPGFWRS